MNTNMNPFYSADVKETLYDVISILEQIITAISRLDFSFFAKYNDQIKLSELFTLLDLYKNADILSYSKRIVIPDTRVIRAKKDLAKIDECFTYNKVIFLNHILIWNELAKNCFIKFELENIDDKIGKIENKELQIVFLQEQMGHLIYKNATHDYTFYNEIFDYLKTMLSYRYVSSYDITVKKALDAYLKLEKDKKTIIDSKDLLSPLLDGNIELIKDRLNSLLKLPTFFEVGKQYPENDYHLFLLGFFQSELKMYHVQSNIPNYCGRLDIGLEPIDLNSNLFCYIVELKNQNTVNPKKAIAQIEKNDYKSSFERKGFKKFIYIAVNFNGRNFEIEIEHR